MSTSQPRNSPCYPQRMRRRNFLATAGASAFAMKAGILDFASSLFGNETSPPSKPRVRAVFVRPDKDRYWIGWPGASYDVEARQTEYTKILTEAAREQGIQLEVSPLYMPWPNAARQGGARGRCARWSRDRQCRILARGKIQVSGGPVPDTSV